MVYGYFIGYSLSACFSSAIMRKRNSLKGKMMIIILTLLTMLVILVSFLIIGVASAGAAFIIIFGDVLVAIGFIMYLIHYISKKRKEK